LETRSKSIRFRQLNMAPLKLNQAVWQKIMPFEANSHIIEKLRGMWNTQGNLEFSPRVVFASWIWRSLLLEGTL
jgi:hypothetical protein